MPLQFNDTQNLQGIVQRYEEEALFEVGEVSGNATKLKLLTSRVNSYLGRFQWLALQAAGTWQADDSNHGDLPVIRTNIVSGQRDYPFLTDEQGNLILDFYRVRVADAAGVFHDVKPVDIQQRGRFSLNDTETGVPTEYDKTANALIFNRIFNYSLTNGIEAYINRAPSFFVPGDTDKKPGIPVIFHEYLAVGPASDRAGRLTEAQFAAIVSRRMAMEEDIKAYFSKRTRDERPRLSVSQDSNE